MRSDNVKSGTERAPHRSLFNALGYTDEELQLSLIHIYGHKILLQHCNREL